MIAPHRPSLVALMIIGMVSRAEAQATTPPKAGAVPGPIELTVSHRAAEVPAFRHRLFPLSSERTPGDAAPIYLRLHGEFTDGMKQLTNGKAAEWLALPMDQFPAAEAQTFVNRFLGRIEQIGFGARRRTCDWNYTLPEEREHSYEILLPDVQEMRQWGRMLAVKARVEIAEGKVDEAIRTLETGLGFARHVSEGPFLINGLVGAAVATMMLEQVDELIARPDAPNLYWPLTALPRPFLDLRSAFEVEMKMIDWAFPELGEIDRTRTDAEWSSLLARLHARMVATWNGSGLFDAEAKKPLRFEVDLARFRASLLPEAREHIKARSIPVDGQPEDKILMVFLADLHREIRDDFSRPFYLPYADAAPVRAEVDRRHQTFKSGPLGMFVSLAPNVEAAHAVQARLDRKVAAIRAVEAIRMQAAADGGKVPDSLERVTVAPVPLDPATGRAFEYRREGDRVVLSSAVLHGGRLTYQLRFRK